MEMELGIVCDPDRDGDGVDNDQDTCPGVIPGDEQEDPDGNGCYTDPDIGGECVNESICDIEEVDLPCVVGGNDQDLGFLRTSEVNNAAILNPDTGIVLGSFTDSRDGNGNLVLTITLVEVFSLSGYVLKIHPVDAGTNGMSETYREFAFNASASGDGASETFVNVKQGEDVYISLKAWICPPVLP